jgi:cyclase
MESRVVQRMSEGRLGRWPMPVAALALTLALVVPLAAQPARGTPEPKIDIWPVRDNIFMLVGEGGNTTVQLGEDGVLVVDTKLAPAGDALLAAIRKISDKPIRYVVNTHAHADHVGGNAVIAAAGSTIAGGNVSGAIADADVGAAVLAHENVLGRMDKADPPYPFKALPTDTYFVPEKDLYFNDEAIELIHMPAAHTDGDSIVFFRRSDVISAGDVYINTTYPVILPGDGGSIQGIIDALNRIIAITVPKDKQEGGTMVIPGHGRLADEADVVEYRDMLTILRDRVKSMIDMGLTLKQVKAAEPTRDYDGRYGATSGSWTTDQFIEALYRTLAEPARSK